MARVHTKDNLNAIRLSMALLVIFSHSFAVLDVPEPEILDWTLGTFAVQVFFAVSGYLIAGSYMRRPRFVAFGVNRALRILPGLVVAKIFTWSFFTCFDEYKTNPAPFLPNNSLWTIRWELTCYGACAMAGMLGLLHVGRFNVLFTIVLLMVLVSNAGSADGYYVLILPMLLSFLTGGFVAVSESRIDMRLCSRFSVFVLVALLLDQQIGYLFHVFQFIPSMSKSYLTELELLPKILCTAFCAIYVGKYAPPRVVIQQDYSYGMYLYAWPIQQAIVSGTLSIGWPIGPIGLFVAATQLTFCIAVPSWHFVEKPAWRLKVRGVWPQPKVRKSAEG